MNPLILMPTNKYNTNENNGANKSVHSDQVKNAFKSDKTVRKPEPGRTLVVTSITGKLNENELKLKDMCGLKSNTLTKSEKSCFLTFDSLENAEKAYNKLHSDSSKYRVKYSYYRVFFRISNLTDDQLYKDVRKDLTTLVQTISESSVLYCKLYCNDKDKGNGYIGCGDFTIDTLEGMKKLLNTESTEPYSKPTQFTTPVKQLLCTFYRYKNKKENSNKQNEHGEQSEHVEHDEHDEHDEQ
jgi:mRNA-degrading endonuclease RelE of RelBE toxin-antitoxin system